MNKAEMIEVLQAVLAEENEIERGWDYFKWIIGLNSLQELQMAQEIVKTEPDLRVRVPQENAETIQRQIELYQELASTLPLVGAALARYPHVAKRVTGDAHKIALLGFVNFCECDIAIVCAALDQIIGGLESSEVVEIDASSVLKAMAYFTERPCHVLRCLLLPEVETSGYRGSGDVVHFRREKAD